MKKALKRYLVFILAFSLTAGTFLGGKADALAASAATYNFSSMSYHSSYGLEQWVGSAGELNVNFQGQYKEVVYTLPNSINMSTINTVNINADCGGNVAFKFYNLSGEEVFVKWNCNGSSQNFTYDAGNVTDTIGSIGIMSQDNSYYNTVVYSVSFEGTGGTQTGSSLKDSYTGIFGKIGSAVTLNQLKDGAALNHIKTQYNSVTMENEMKPDALLGASPTLITVQEAKNRGYIIPDGYQEAQVPEINFTNVDAILKIVSENGLSLRFHTLIWHNQTPAWFFKYDYNAGYNYSDTGTMDARIEYYVKNVVAHVTAGEYSDCVYAWDIANEYFHNTDGGTCHWTQIYGQEGNSPSYIKKAFTYAADMLSYYGVRDQVKLFYNDYNCYMISDEIVSLFSYLNSERKICDGIGMQSHLDVEWPSIDYISAAVQKFLNAGAEVQMTEIDVTINAMGVTHTLTEQADYYSEFMKMLINKKKNGGMISGITFWGLYDSASWRASGQPLLFSSLNNPKEAYYAVLNAAASK